MATKDTKQNTKKSTENNKQSTKDGKQNTKGNDNSDYQGISHHIRTALHITNGEIFPTDFLGIPSIDVVDNTLNYNLNHGDYFTEHEFKLATSYLRNEETWKSNEKVKECVSLYKSELIQRMKDAFRYYRIPNGEVPAEDKKLLYAKSTPKSATIKNPELYLEYPEDTCRLIYKYLDNLDNSSKDVSCSKENEENVLHITWCIVYLIVFKELSHSKINNSWQQYYIEYMQQVERLYGGTTSTARRAIVNLANKGNVVAQYSLGELYMSGRFSDDGTPQYKEAYKQFLKSAGELKKDATDSLTEDSGSLSQPTKEAEETTLGYPLACWNMAYLLFNYGRRGFLRELECIDALNEINNDEDKIDNAISYCFRALKSDNEFYPAYNLLGVILDVLEEEQEEIKKYSKSQADAREKLIEKITKSDMLLKNSEIGNNNIITAEDLFKYAATDNCYVEAVNNQWRRACKLSIKNEENADGKYLEQAIGYLKEAADHQSNWARNKLGEYFRTGTMVIHSEINHKMVSISRNYGKTIVDYNIAMGYYLSAINGDFINNSSAWAAFHLLEMHFNENIPIISLAPDKLDKCVRIILATNNKDIEKQINKAGNEKIKNILYP